MTYYIKRGANFHVTGENNFDIRTLLPVGNYTVNQNEMTGEYYLSEIAEFSVKGKRYGHTDQHVDRILSTFADRSASTGVLLAGEKGSGKSLLAKSVAIKAAEDGIPTIVINTPHCGDNFNQFIQTIDQPCVVLFDEFEKVYNSENQEQLLTLLDGVFASKKLFVLTVNDKYRVDYHMRNRPGRIFYLFDFAGLEVEVIKEYCQDNLINKSHIDQVCRVSGLFKEFTFDMLTALVQEMNRYGETPQQAMKHLNAKPESDKRQEFNVSLAVDGKVIGTDDLNEECWQGQPLEHAITVWYNKEKDYDDNQRFEPSDLFRIEPEHGKFVFKNKEGAELTLTRKRTEKYDYWNAF